MTSDERYPARPGRRAFLTGAAATAGALLLPDLAGPALAAAGAPARIVALHNLHTGERLKTAYWERGTYIPDALEQINVILRDFRTGDVHPIEPRLIDVLQALRGALDTTTPFDVICGYRSPKTNAALAARSSAVATNSLHMQGMAIDILLPDRPLAELHRAAKALRAGGVGYYPETGFVHVDIGRVRYW